MDTAIEEYIEMLRGNLLKVSSRRVLTAPRSVLDWLGIISSYLEQQVNYFMNLIGRIR
jgi:hypothetical protein